MENLSRTYKTHHVYDDVFSTKPKFTPLSLSPRIEDYAEIFKARVATSVPVLDLPAADVEEVVLFKGLRYDYLEVFRGSDGGEFVLFEDLVGKGCDSSDEAWTPDPSEIMSDESEPLACSDRYRRTSNAESQHSRDGTTEFKVSYNKVFRTSEDDMANGLSRVTLLDEVPGYSFMVNEARPPQKVVVTNNLRHEGFSGEIREAKQLKKSISCPNKPFVTVSDISLKTRPSHLPPPSRPPPSAGSKDGDSDTQSLKMKASRSFAFGETTSDDDSPLFYDVEVDASSSAAVSAAAMKDVMEKAQEKLKSAKHMKERSKKEKIHGETSERDFGGAKCFAENGRKHGKGLENSSLKNDGNVEWKQDDEFYEVVETEDSRNYFDVRNDQNFVKHNLQNNELRQEKRENGANSHEEVVDRKLKSESEIHEKIIVETVRGEDFDNMAKVWEQESEDVKRYEKDFDIEEHGMRLGGDAERERFDNRFKEATERAKTEKRMKETLEREKKEKTERDTRERNLEEIRKREAIEQEENEKRLRIALEEKEKKQREVLEKEEKEKREKEAREKEEKEKRLRLALAEKEEKQRRVREREEKEKEVRERELEERRLREATEKEEKEKRLRLALQEKEKREREARERKEKEQRDKEAREREFEEKRLREAIENEENEKRLRLALEEKEKREREARERVEKEAKEAREREEKEKRDKEAREREEKEKRDKKAREREEKEKRDKEAREREAEENKRKQILEEEEKKQKEAQDREEKEKREKEVRRREFEEKRLRDALEQEEKEKKLNIALEKEKNEKRLNLACERDEAEKKLKEHKERDCELKEDTQHVVEQVPQGEDNEKRSKEAFAFEREDIDKMWEESYGLDENAASYEAVNKVIKKSSEMKKIKELKLGNSSSSSVGRDDLQYKKSEFTVSKSKGSLPMPDTVFEFEKIPSKKNANFAKLNVVDYELGERDGSKEKFHVAKDKKEEKIMSSKEERAKVPSQNAEKKGKNLGDVLSREEKEREERLIKERKMENERLRKIEEEKEREREREKDRMAVNMASLEKAAVEKATMDARQKKLMEARERLEKVNAEARMRAERVAVERATAEARERAFQKAKAESATLETRERAERMRQSSFKADSSVGAGTTNGSTNAYSSVHGGVEVESAQRCKARLERHQRTAQRAAKALEEKNMRDLLAQRELAERNRLAEGLDAEVKRWSSGKEGNLRALLSTLQYILGPDSGWQPIHLTEVITSAAVKRAYRKATLCVHPDKLQQRGASIHQKYICEKVFDLLKAAWNKFNSEER